MAHLTGVADRMAAGEMKKRCCNGFDCQMKNKQTLAVVFCDVCRLFAMGNCHGVLP